MNSELHQYLSLSFQGAKKSGDLAFYIIPAKKPLEAPLVIIHRASVARNKYKEARKWIKANDKGSFNFQKVVAGRVEKQGKRLILVLEEANDKLQGQLGTWALKIKKEDADNATKLAALLDKALVTTEAELGDLTVTEATYDVDLDEVFGDDAPKVQKLAPELDTLNTQLAPTGTSVDSTTFALASEMVQKTLGVSVLEMLGGAAEAVPLFIKMAASGASKSSAPLDKGSTTALADLVGTLATQFAKAVSLFKAWDRRLVVAETLEEELGEVEKAFFDGGSEWASEQEQNDYNELFDNYWSAAKRGNEAGDLAEDTLSTLTAQHAGVMKLAGKLELGT